MREKMSIFILLLWLLVAIGFGSGGIFLLLAFNDWRIEKKTIILVGRKEPKQSRSLGIASDIGNNRVNNEDSVATVQVRTIFESNVNNKFLLIVTDGMGGGNKGEYASTQCVKRITSGLLMQLVSSDDVDYCVQLKDIITNINRQLFSKASTDSEYKGMGTTVTTAVIDGSQVYFGNVGDTRAYLIRNGLVNAITHDHSLVQEMVDRGEITPQEAKNHPQRNVITRVVGYYETVKVDLFQILIEKSDRILICSDGVHNYLDDVDILRIISEKGDPQEAVEAFISTAKEKGSVDNLSAILYYYQS
jgi:protein phosphatase